MFGEAIRTVTFLEFWTAQSWEVPIYLDRTENFTVFLRVTSPSDKSHYRLVIQRRYIQKTAHRPIGWVDDDRLIEALPVDAGQVVALAVDQAWFQEQMANDPATRVSFAVLVGADGWRTHKINLTLTPKTSQFRNPAIDVKWPNTISLDRQVKRDYVELAKLELHFDPLAKFYDGEIPKLRVVASLKMESAKQQASLRLIQEPPDRDTGSENHIEGIQSEGGRTIFITSLSNEGEESISYRLMARECDLRTTIAQLRQPERSDIICTAMFDISVTCILQLDSRDQTLTDEVGHVEISFSPEETIAISFAEESPPILLTVDNQLETLDAGVRAQIKSGQVFIQRSLGLTIHYNGFPFEGQIFVRWVVVLGDQKQALSDDGPPNLSLPADASTHSFLIPIQQLMADRLHNNPGGGGTYSCVISFEIQSVDATNTTRFSSSIRVPIAVDRDPQWILCVDLGTSAVAAWCGATHAGTPRVAHQLPMGAWLEELDKNHQESGEIGTNSHTNPAWRDRTFSRLLPSHIGLASDFNFRDRFDALSLGDLATLGSSNKEVLARLKSRGRRYDISAPFPSSERMHDYFDQIIFEPKRKLITCSEDNWTIRLGKEIMDRVHRGERLVQNNRVDLLDILSDYFDELATFVVPRVLEWAARQTRSTEAQLFQDDLNHWLDGPDHLQLIITHPTGMSHEKRRLYQVAANKFATSFELGSANETESCSPSVVLVPESLAAARFGISRLFEPSQGVASVSGPQLFVTLDIGAGTYDVTVLTAQIERGDPVAWRIHSHFGITVGGIELDRALTARIVEIYHKAADDRQLKDYFDFVEFGLPTCIADVAHADDDRKKKIGVRFLNEVKTAKVTLTSKILASVRNGPFKWDDAAAQDFNVKLGEPSALWEWPIRIKKVLDVGTEFPIAAEPGVFLRIDSDSNNVKAIRLIVPHAALAGGDLKNWVHVLGKVIPSIARGAAQMYGDNQIPHWIVTGRTALWPDLYSAIVQVVQDPLGGSPGVISQQPYGPLDMKVAVIEGAQMLAAEPHLDAGNRVFNPLAIVRMVARPGGGNRITAINYITDSEFASGEIPLTDGHSYFQLVRAVPCLDKMDPRTGKMLVELLEETPNCPPLWRPVSHLRDVQRAYREGASKICWQTDSKRRTKITVVTARSEILEIFSFSEETVYGY